MSLELTADVRRIGCGSVTSPPVSFRSKQIASGAFGRSSSLSRREWLRVGGLGTLGVSLSGLFGAAAQPASHSVAGSFGRAKACILIFMSGGPPQHETFDPKPGAPLEIRGTLGSIPTSVPGIHFSETLPHTAKLAHRMAVIRSMTTDINSHSTSGYPGIWSALKQTPFAERRF